MAGSTTALMACGIPAVAAEIIGDSTAQNIAGVGTAQAGAAVLSGTVNTVTTASGQTATILKSHNAGRTVEVFNLSATAALVFPPVGATMNGTLNASQSIAQNKGAFFRYITPLIVVAIAGA